MMAMRSQGGSGMPRRMGVPRTGAGFNSPLVGQPMSAAMSTRSPHGAIGLRNTTPYTTPGMPNAPGQMHSVYPCPGGMMPPSSSASGGTPGGMDDQLPGNIGYVPSTQQPNHVGGGGDQQMAMTKANVRFMPGGGGASGCGVGTPDFASPSQTSAQASGEGAGANQKDQNHSS